VIIAMRARLAVHPSSTSALENGVPTVPIDASSFENTANRRGTVRDE
jgi:hypothetical protein